MIVVFPQSVNASTATPLLKPWGGLADLVATLVKNTPDLAPRLMFLPMRGLHSTAVALHVAKTVGEPVEKMAIRVLRTHPRDLLREAVPSAIPEMYRLLDKAAGPAWSYAAYRDLERLLRSRVASTLLDAPAISPARVQSALALLEADPVVWHARKAFRYDHERCHLSTVVEMLRALGLLQELADLPEGAGRKSVYRRLRADLARGRAFRQPFPDVPGWAPVEGVGALWEIGERLGICVRPDRWEAARYVLGLISGEHVFLHNPEHDLLAQVQFVVGDIWTVVQISGTRNRDAPLAVRRSLNEALVAGGLLLVPSAAEEALSAVLRQDRERDPFFDGADDDDDADVDIAT